MLYNSLSSLPLNPFLGVAAASFLLRPHRTYKQHLRLSRCEAKTLHHSHQSPPFSLSLILFSLILYGNTFHLLWASTLSRLALYNVVFYFCFDIFSISWEPIYSGIALAIDPQHYISRRQEHFIPPSGHIAAGRRILFLIVFIETSATAAAVCVLPVKNESGDDGMYRGELANI